MIQDKYYIMTKKFDDMFLELMASVDVMGDASAGPYDTSDARVPKILGKVRKRKKVCKESSKKDWENVPKPDDMKDLMNQCSLGKDKDGYFAYTHRARTNSYSDPHKIPKSKIEFINSTS